MQSLYVFELVTGISGTLLLPTMDRMHPRFCYDPTSSYIVLTITLSFDIPVTPLLDYEAKLMPAMYHIL